MKKVLYCIVVGSFFPSWSISGVPRERYLAAYSRKRKGEWKNRKEKSGGLQPLKINGSSTIESSHISRLAGWLHGRAAAFYKEDYFWYYIWAHQSRSTIYLVQGSKNIGSDRKTRDRSIRSILWSFSPRRSTCPKVSIRRWHVLYYRLQDWIPIKEGAKKKAKHWIVITSCAWQSGLNLMQKGPSHPHSSSVFSVRLIPTSSRYKTSRISPATPLDFYQTSMYIEWISRQSDLSFRPAVYTQTGRGKDTQRSIRKMARPRTC